MSGDTRACGTCTVCCTLMGVTELNKLPGVGCEHCTGTSCGNYATRPETCAGFQCGWLSDSQMSDQLRPDRSGVLLVWAEDNDSAVAKLDPARPMAIKDPAVQIYLTALIASGTVVFVVLNEELQSLHYSSAALAKKSGDGPDALRELISRLDGRRRG